MISLKFGRGIGLLSLTLTAGLVGCGSQESEPLELEETVDIQPLDDQDPERGTDEHLAADVVEPVLPDIVGENSPAGAKATVEYFWQGIDYVRQTGVAQPAASVSHYMCDVCTEFVFRWQQMYDAGAWATLDGATEIEVVETQSYLDEEDQSEWTAVIFNVTEPASEFYLDGQLVEEESLAETTLDGWWAELTYDDENQRWQIEWIDQDDDLLS